MPNNSGIPRTESVSYFEATIAGHSAVSRLDRRGENVYVVQRRKYSPVVVFLTDIYTIGIADVVDARTKICDINYIVTISNWNGYTSAAKEHANSAKIGIGLMSEFMGALNLEEPWKYVKRNDKNKG